MVTSESLNTGLPGTPISQLEYILREVFAILNFLERLLIKDQG